MWNNLMRRWLEMATWWLPKHEDEPTPEPAKPTSAETSAEASAADDLTDIRGIGPAMQRRLEGLGIRSHADLAAADPETLTERLKADRAVVSRAQVATWIDAAGH